MISNNDACPHLNGSNNNIEKEHEKLVDCPTQLTLVIWICQLCSTTNTTEKYERTQQGKRLVKKTRRSKDHPTTQQQHCQHFMGRLVDNYIVDHGPVTSNLHKSTPQRWWALHCFAWGAPLFWDHDFCLYSTTTTTTASTCLGSFLLSSARPQLDLSWTLKNLFLENSCKQQKWQQYLLEIPLCSASNIAKQNKTKQQQQ